MSMFEFTIESVAYRAGKLNAFQQLHVSRRIAPLLPSLLPAVAFANNIGELLGNPIEASKVINPLIRALAEMSDADCEFVYGACLSVVSRSQDKSWASIWNESRKALMFDDIELAAMTRIVVEVIKDSLGNFMRGFLADRSSNPTPPLNG